MSGSRISQGRGTAPAAVPPSESGQRPDPASRAAGVGVWDWDLRSDELVYSQRARQICGFPPAPAPVTHADTIRVTHPDDLARSAAQTRRALDPALRDRAPLEYRIVRPDGEVRWVLACGEAVFEQVDGADRAVRYVGTLQDVTGSYRLREALVESERRLRLAIDAARLAIWEVDLRTEALAGSPELNRLLGFPEEEHLTLERIRSGNLPGETERVRAITEAAIARGERFVEAEYQYRWPNGELRTLLLRAEIKPDEQGQPGRIVGVLLDLTGRRRAEEALRSSEARLKLAQQAANIGVWDWDAVSGRMTWSPEMYTLFGLQPSESSAELFEAWRRLLHPEDRERLERLVETARKQGWHDSTDYRIRHGATGEVRWIRAYGASLDGGEGRPRRLVGANLDVTDLHRRHEVLEQSNRTLREMADRDRRERERVFEMSHDLIAVAGVDGRLKVVNPAWTRVLGYAAEELVGEPYLGLVHREDATMASYTIEALRQGCPVPRVEVRMRRADGAWRWIAWTAVAEGQVIYGVGRDVTQQRRAAQELEEANRELRMQIAERERVEQTLRQMQRLEAVGQLTSGVAHDFNNLLTVILGNLDVLEGKAHDDRLRQRLGLMRQAALRGATLTAQLLAFSRRQRLEPKPVDLNETVLGMGELLHSTMGGSAQVRIDCQPELWPALVDPTQIELAILNLAINARDAMAVGGTLRVSTTNEHRTHGPQAPGEPGPGDFVVIAVSDTGAGMSEEVRSRAFEPFFTTKDVGKGSGLGLAQVLGFAQQSGGGVAIQSVPGQGTTVSVYLPRADGATDAPAAPKGAAPEHRTSASEHCVLLVDDDAAVREVTGAKLRQMGLRVVEAASGAAGLEALAGARPVDLIVADFAMPGMNGVEMVRHARQRRPDIPVLFVTGYADQSLLADGNERVVQKPFRDDELQREVRALLAGG